MPKAKEIPAEEREVLTVPEAGRLLGLTRARAYDYAARGQFPTIRLGGRILVPRVRFYAWLRGQQAVGEGKTAAAA